jgi:hypothetical protein
MVDWRVARPSKRTPELTEKIKDAIAHGMNHGETADLAGIHRDTLREWMEDPEFAEEVAQAKAERKLQWIKIVQSGKNWFGAAFLLERTDPMRWSKPELQWQFSRFQENGNGNNNTVITEAEILKHIATVRGLENGNGK